MGKNWHLRVIRIQSLSFSQKSEKRFRLLDSKKLSQQLSIFREKLESKKNFSLSWDIQEIEPAIKAYLQEHFEEAELTTHQKKSWDDLYVQLKGEGYIFSRSLDEDLERLLKSDF